MIQPTTPYDDRPADATRDLSGGYSLHALERMVQSFWEQPRWRLRSSICHAYYDGKQLTPEQEALARSEGLEPRSTNLVRPIINSVLGQEAKSRTDVTLEADDEAYAEVVDALKPKFKEAERETCAHAVVSDGYAGGVKGGIGWAEVGRSSDPLAYPYRVETVHRDEIWWDWKGQTGTRLNEQCRWLVRKRWIDLDEAQANFPQFAKVLEQSVKGWEGVFLLGEVGNFLGDPGDYRLLAEAHENERRFQVPRYEWCDSARKMVMFYEVWYRVPAQVVVLHLGTGRVVYDEKDPRHVAAVSRNLVKVSKAITSQVRMALYAGPHRIIDKATNRRRFPYIPFFAYRDDADGSPYGLIDGMISPQDEYNERRLRIQWLLKARQIQLDNDALDPTYNTIADVADAIMRPDLQIITNPNRQNRNSEAVKIGNQLSLQTEQFNVMQDSKELIQHTAGRFNSQLGSAQVQSGIANSILVEQGEQAMAEMNDNYVFFRRGVFEALAEEIVQDHLNEQLTVMVGTGKARRPIVLNTWDPQTGQPKNQVKDANVKVAVSDTPATPAFRQQTQNNIATIISALGGNPQAVAVLTPSFLESSNIPNRQQVADDFRKAVGMPLAGDKAGQEQAEKAQAAQAQKAAQIQDEMAMAKVLDTKATAQSKAATARLNVAQAIEIEQRLQQQADLRQRAAVTAKTLAEARLTQARTGTELARDDLDEDAIAREALAEADS